MSFQSGSSLGRAVKQRRGQSPAVIVVEHQNHRAADLAFEVQDHHRQPLVVEIQFEAGVGQRQLAHFV